MSTAIIRHERPDDGSSISRVHSSAFGQPDEATLVAALRRTNSFDPSLSLVAVLDDVVVGHILFSPITIVDDSRSHKALALAPMAVIPEHQRKGIGGKLIISGLRACRAAGHGIVVVLGHPKYYPRFGFISATRHGIVAPFPVPDGALMVQWLRPDGSNDVKGTVQYPPAFQIE